MSNFKHYIASFRLRTLPLSLSGIILGSLLASSVGYFNLTTFILAITTTLCLQILSNLANELGDLQKGTDNEQRLGPIRSIQSGAITIKAFKQTIGVFILLSICSGVALIFLAFDALFSQDGIILLALGGISIVAALKYTIGKGAYGYHGLGDLFVFLFFGLLSVSGSWFLMTHSLDFSIFLPAASIGLLATGVLNLNNMRDIENDHLCGKHTLPVLIGISKAKIYHTGLIIGAFLTMIIYMYLQGIQMVHFSFLLTLPLFIIHIQKVRNAQGRTLDAQLKILSIYTFIFALISGFSL